MSLRDGGQSRVGRPAVGPQTKIAFPPSLLARVDAAAKRDGVSRSEWVRRACTWALGGI